MPRIYGEDAGGMWSGGDWTPPVQPTQAPTPNPAPGYDARSAGQDIASGGATREEQYQAAYRQGLINAQQLRDALIEKDRLLQQWRGSTPGWGGSGWQNYGSGGGQPTSPATPTGVSPDWSAAGQSPWLNPQFWQSPYAGSQPTLNFANTDWASVSPQYRPGVDAWLRLQGFKPSGSLGQYNYNQWRAPQQVQFSQDMVNTVPDESLRAWIQKLLTGKGWM